MRKLFLLISWIIVVSWKVIHIILSDYIFFEYQVLGPRSILITFIKEMETEKYNKLSAKSNRRPMPPRYLDFCICAFSSPDFICSPFFSPKHLRKKIRLTVLWYGEKLSFENLQSLRQDVMGNYFMSFKQKKRLGFRSDGWHIEQKN